MPVQARVDEVKIILTIIWDKTHSVVFRATAQPSMPNPSPYNQTISRYLTIANDPWNVSEVAEEPQIPPLVAISSRRDCNSDGTVAQILSKPQ